MELFKNLFASLNQASVKYLVVGGVAVNLYGIQRATADLDIVLKLDDRNVKQFIRVAKRLGLRPKMPINIEDFADPQKREEWLHLKNMQVFSLYDEKKPFFLLDVFVEEPFNFDLAYGSKESFYLEDAEIPVVAISHLIEMKKGSGRPQDLADIYHLGRLLDEWQRD